MESMQFEITNNEGKKIFCDVIATYHDNDTNKDFIVYTDGTFSVDNKLNLYYSLYKEVGSRIELIDIIDIEDKKIGLQLIQEILEDISNK